jgi:DNA replication protein DnaC
MTATEIIEGFRSTEIVRKLCHQCGNEFETHPMLIYCDKCVDDYHQKAESHQSNEKVKSFLERIPFKIRNTVLEKLPSRDKAKEALSHDWNSGMGLALYGVTGKGKSRTAFLCLVEAIKQGRSVDWVDGSKLKAIALKPYDNEETLKHAKRVGVLLIDDLGNEPESPAVEDVLWDIIKFRDEEGKLLLVTSQFNRKTLKLKFRSPERGESIARRLDESCVGINFNG